MNLTNLLHQPLMKKCYIFITADSCLANTMIFHTAPITGPITAFVWSSFLVERCIILNCNISASEQDICNLQNTSTELKHFPRFGANMTHLAEIGLTLVYDRKTDYSRIYQHRAVDNSVTLLHCVLRVTRIIYYRKGTLLMNGVLCLPILVFSRKVLLQCEVIASPQSLIQTGSIVTKASQNHFDSVLVE